MKLWLLRPIGGKWSPWFDKAHGFVIRAPSEIEARIMAHADGGEETRENPRAWFDPALTVCEELTAVGEHGVILRDFRSA